MSRSASQLRLSPAARSFQPAKGPAGRGPARFQTQGHSPDDGNLGLVIRMIRQISAIERAHGEDVALAVVEDLKRVMAKGC